MGTSKLDAYGVPVELVAVVLSLMGYLVFNVDHFFQLEEINNPGQPEIVSTQVTETQPENKYFRDIKKAIDKRLQKQPEGDRTLVVVATSGGGIQASGWTTQVLGGLQEGYQTSANNTPLIQILCNSKIQL